MRIKKEVYIIYQKVILHRFSIFFFKLLCKRFSIFYAFMQYIFVDVTEILHLQRDADSVLLKVIDKNIIKQMRSLKNIYIFFFS